MFCFHLSSEAFDRVILETCKRLVESFLAAEGIDSATLRLAIDSPIQGNELQALGIPAFSFAEDVRDHGPWGAYARWSVGKNWDDLTKLRVLLFAIKVALSMIDFARDPIAQHILESLKRAWQRFELSSTEFRLEDLPRREGVLYEGLKTVWERANLPSGLALEFYFAESQELSEVLEQILMVHAPEKFKDKAFIIQALGFLAGELYKYLTR